jgi:integral membrane sensor domain MASE1
MKKTPPTDVPTAWSPKVRLGLSSLAYFLAQELAFKLPDSFGLIASIWPAAGIALASLLLSPRRLWPELLGCLFAAGLAANLTTVRPFSASVGFMVANICETAASAWLITRWCGGSIRFARVGEVLALADATFLVNTVTAFIGAGAAYLSMGTGFWTFSGPGGLRTDWGCCWSPR